MKKLLRIIASPWISIAFAAVVLGADHFLYEKTIALRENMGSMCADIGIWHGVTKPRMQDQQDPRFFHWAYRSDFTLSGDLKGEQ